MLENRAELCGIITKNLAKKFYIEAAKMGWRKHEPSRIPMEQPTLFTQLVFRAVNEEEISTQKAAELLKWPINKVEEECVGIGGEAWNL